MIKYCDEFFVVKLSITGSDGARQHIAILYTVDTICVVFVVVFFDDLIKVGR